MVGSRGTAIERNKNVAKIKRSVVFFVGLAVGIFITSMYLAPESEAYAVNDREYFPEVQSLLENAEESIHIIIFEVKYYTRFPNSNEMKILYELANAQKRGVDVKIVTDQFLTDDEAINYLTSKGINIKYDAAGITTHSKLLIIDGEIVVIGSTNWSYYSIDLNHESNAVIKNKQLAREFEEYFEKIWNES